MIEVGKNYKMKKIVGFPGVDPDYQDEIEVLKISGDNVYCKSLTNGENYIFNKQFIVDPEFPEDDKTICTPVDEALNKLENVIKPNDMSYWKSLKEEGACAGVATGMAATGTAPCPAMGQITGGNVSGCMVNGIPVAGKSTKKKRKKKNEDIDLQGTIFEPHVDKYTEKTEIMVSPDEMLEMVEETFDPTNILVTIVYNNRETIKVSVKYDTSAPSYIHLLKKEYLDIDGETVLEETEEEYTLQDCLVELTDIFSRHTNNEYFENVIENLLNEDFNEEYEEITELIAKQLDRMNFEFANTEDIIYKKEGAYKYLLKFDNKDGYLKFKVSQGDNVLEDKEWKLEEGQDISPIFQEIEEIYRNYGI